MVYIPYKLGFTWNFLPSYIVSKCIIWCSWIHAAPLIASFVFNNKIECDTAFFYYLIGNSFTKVDGPLLLFGIVSYCYTLCFKSFSLTTIRIRFASIDAKLWQGAFKAVVYFQFIQVLIGCSYFQLEGLIVCQMDISCIRTYFNKFRGLGVNFPYSLHITRCVGEAKDVLGTVFAHYFISVFAGFF